MPKVQSSPHFSAHEVPDPPPYINTVWREGFDKPQTSYSEEMAEYICTRISGGESLTSVCATPGTPPRAAIYAWLARYPKFRALYNRARRDQADALFDEILDIADDARNDWMEKNPGTGALSLDHEAIARSQLRINARKYITAKINPKKYGEKIESEIKHTGAIGIYDAGKLSRLSEEELKALESILTRVTSPESVPLIGGEGGASEEEGPQRPEVA